MMDDGRRVVIGIGVLALAAAALSAVSIYSTAITAEGEGLLAPPQLVSADVRRERTHSKGLRRCVYDLGGRAMFDSRGQFIGCDRVPDPRVIRQAERGDAP